MERVEYANGGTQSEISYRINGQLMTVKKSELPDIGLAVPKMPGKYLFEGNGIKYINGVPVALCSFYYAPSGETVVGYDDYTLSEYTKAREGAKYAKMKK